MVGDEQDLMQDRSTFSGRLLRLEEAWSAAGPESLVLLDELGSGTDPHEGAALSVALVERLAATSTASLVTTHLLAVAAAAAELEGATCASMEFDHESRLPTYRLLAGPPGGSEAIALARQLELPAEWLDRAEALVGEEHGRLRRLLAEVETVRSELLAEKEGQRRLRQEAAVERQTLAAERKKLVDERRRVAAAAKREIEAFRRRVRERMDHEVRSAREAVEAGRSRTVAADAVRKLFDDAPAELVAPIGGENGRDEELEVGDQVRHVDFTWEGRLESLEGSRATVSIAGKRFECDAGDLRSAPASAPSKSGRGARGRGVEVPSRDVELPVELDLIGQRVEPALEALDRYLDQALLVPYMEVRVVHGHGTGRLRRGIREFLVGHAAVAGVRPGRSNEGGDGVTVVRLAS